jgi:hypothetical protein
VRLALPASTFQVYNFRLDKVEIKTTRSRSTDTVYATLSLAVGTRAPMTRTVAMGDLSEGDYEPNLGFDNVAVFDGEPIVLNYTILNNGHADAGLVENALNQAATTLSNEAARQLATLGGSAIGAALGTAIGTAVVPIAGSALGALAGWLVSKMSPIIFPNCDGFVGAGVHPFTSAELRNQTVGGYSVGATDANYGTDSAAGCGANSVYNVNWSAARVLPNMQAGWRWCSKCQGIFYFGGGQTGRCPTGGDHTSVGSSQYVVQGRSEAQSPGQDDWIWCRLCQGLWFGGALDNNWCPYWAGTDSEGKYAVGGHSFDGSGNYVLVSAGAAFPGQDDWRWCDRCMGLFYIGRNGGRCPAGGSHSGGRSRNYRIRTYHFS